MTMIKNVLKTLKRKVSPQSPPELQQHIQITWLPKKNNRYIGSVGTVRSVYPDGSFDLQYDNGGGIIMVYGDYEYRVVN